VKLRSCGAVLLALAVLLPPLFLGAPPAAAEDEVVIETSFEVPTKTEPDGRPVNLDVSVLTTDPGVARPAVVLAHGFGGSKDDSAETARTLARDGFTVITYTARGFGASGGRIHLDNPAYEGTDTRRLIDFAAERPEVAKSGTDPVIGFAGASYGGAAAILAAGLDPRVDAIAPAFTYSSLTQALVPQYAVRGTQSSAAAVSPVGSPGVFKERWAALFFGAGAQTGTRSGNGDLCGRFAPELCRAYVQTAQSGRPSPGLLALLDQSDLEQVLDQINAPTLIIHGEADTLFPLEHADANFGGLPASTPKAMAWVEGGHDAAIDLDQVLPTMQTWFAQHLKNEPVTALPAFSVSIPQTRLVGQNAGSRPPQVLSAAEYPLGDQVIPTAVPLTGEAQRVVNPPGGVPTALTSLPGTGNALSSVNRFGGYQLAALPGQTAVFTTAPLAAPLTLVGSGRVSLSVTSPGREATLFVSLWDLGPDGSGAQSGVPQTAVLPQLGVAPVHVTGLTPNQATTVPVALPPIAHQAPVGHRLRVVVSTTDQAYAGPGTAAAYTVDLDGPRTLSILPLPLTAEQSSLRVNPILAVVVAILVLAGVVGLIVLWASRRRSQARPDLAGTPLVVEDLVKTYADGLRAVDGVTFRAESGQVVGLLGPNGAGKTTTMRAMVGLIRPDSGAVYVTGEAVHAGADVLGSVGAFIEGPGFLPHLSGLDNVKAYWAATGRPLAEARLDEALAIAGLGTSIRRQVRGYSQGMRQRLGIAQAMLGMPPLLLLDEPTNGLDPPQIRAMRQMLADYAAAGRTVVISSHLLAEVELTCSHVVVMHRGKVILAGAISDLTRSDAMTLIGLAPGADQAAAVALLRRWGADARLDGDLIRVSGMGSRSALVSTLVSAGYEIESVDGRRHLEDVFMSLVGDAGHEVVQARG
jgi:ABC-2 type transport system ATP-binding protein